VLTHYSTFFFLAAALGTPIVLAIVSREWRRRLLRKAVAHPFSTALMFAVPLGVAGGAYFVHVILWGGGRLGHVPEYMFNAATETIGHFLWRNTLNLAAIVLPGGNEFVAGIYNTVQRIALALVGGVVAAGLSQIGRRQAPPLGAVPLVVLIVMIGLNAIGGLTFRYPYGGAARHEFFLVPFAVVVLFTLIESLRRALPRPARSRRVAAGVVACGVAASIVSWGTTFEVHAQAMFQPQMDAFRRAIPAPRAVLLDQFSFINFFSHYHDWQWRAGRDWPGEAVAQVWSVTNGTRRMLVCRDRHQWSYHMGNIDTFDTVVECGQRTGFSRVAIFRTRWWDSPPGLGAFNAQLAAESGLTPTAIAADAEDNLSIEFEIDPATLHECTAPPPAPADLRLVSNADHVVTLAWAPSGNERTRYIVEAGSQPGGTDVLDMMVGRTTSYTAARVAPATYYTRIRARNTCGTSRASAELAVVVR